MTISRIRPRVTVVVVTYNGAQWIEKCLRSVQESSLEPHIIVIDNKSNDGTIECIKSNFSKIELIEENVNHGFGKANNIGIRKALDQGTDYVLLLNQDAYLEKNTIENLVSAFDEEVGNTGIISPLHLAPSGEIDFGFQDHIKRYAPISSQRSILSKERGLFEVGFVNAACWMLSRMAIETVGGFNPLFPHYGEDNDYINRLVFHGLQVRVLSSTNIIHDRIQKHSAEFRKIKKREEVAFIKHLANINLTFNSALLVTLEKYFKEAIYFFFILSWKRVLAIKLGFFKVITMYKSIKHSRSVSKKEGAYL